MQSFLLVFLGAGCGGALRHGVNMLTGRLLGVSFPYGTLTVNILGSFLLGLLVAWLALKGQASQGVRLFLTTGLLGGFTTFSAFALDYTLIWQRGDSLLAAVYLLASVGISILMVMVAYWLVRSVVGL